MSNRCLRLLGGVALLAASTSVSAAEIGGVLYMNLDHGGETLVSTSEGNIKSGGLVHLAGGLAIHGYGNGSFETQLTAGMKADSVSASNGTVSFYRWPIELMQFYKHGMFRVGAGLTYHVNPELDCDVDYECNWTVEFDNALGYVGQADFVLPMSSPWVRELTLGARFTFIEYEEKTFGEKIDGDSIGVSLGIAF